MNETWTLQLEAWHEFYLLIGTAGLTLTGLLFVVVSLGPHIVANRKATGVRAFVSPNAVFFTSILVVSALFLVPGLSAATIGILLCCGVGPSLIYLAYTRAHQQWRHNKLPVLDWIWFVALPPLGYALLILGGVGLVTGAYFSMHAVATALVLLLVVGIRNAWDLVLWISSEEHRR